MSNYVKYYVSGRFEGYFKTFQDLALKAGDPFPEGSKHLIRIYRGTIFDHHQINQNEFSNSVGDISVGQINNIQIESGTNWPVKHARIFSLAQYKLLNPQINVVHSLNGQTYGKITGIITASVTEGVYEEPVAKDKPERAPIPRWRFWKDENDNANTNNNNGTTPETHDENINFIGKQPMFNNRGCFRKFNFGNGCLKWLLGLLLLAVLLYVLFNATEWGEQIICRFQKWKLQREIKSVREEREKLEEIVQRTRPQASQCGASEAFKGTNEPQRFTYTLGQTSGNVFIVYDMFKVPDRMEVMFNGQLVAETNDSDIEAPEFEYLENMGFADKKDTLIFQYQYNPRELHELTIRIVPNQDKETTQWEFNVICPQ